MTDSIEALRDYIERQERSIAKLNERILSLEIKQARTARYIKAYLDYRSPSDLDSALAILETK